MNEVSQAPPGWVPVERRWLGLDRGSLPPALAVFVIALVMAVVLPLLNQAVPWDDEIEPGDRVDLGSGISLAPPAGWQLEKGVRVGAGGGGALPIGGDAQLAGDGVVVTIHSAAFAGTPDQLLDQVEKTAGEAAGRSDVDVTGARSTVITTGGVTGVTEDHSGPSTEGLLAAFVFGSGAGRVGVTVTVSAPQGGLAPVASRVRTMLTGLTQEARS